MKKKMEEIDLIDYAYKFEILMDIQILINTETIKN